MKSRIGKISIAVLVTVVLLLLMFDAIVPMLSARPTVPADQNAMIGNYTGPIGGAAQDDNIKASLDLAHTDIDAILADTAAQDTAAEMKALTGTAYAAQVISCATSDFTASADDIFVVAGGPILITDFFGICTTVAAGSPGDMKIWCDATTADQDRDFSTTVTVDTLGAGDSVRFTNAIDEGVLDFTPNVGAGQPLSWICPIGTIEQSLTSTGTGAVTWYMVYVPLSSSSAVTAAP